MMEQTIEWKDKLTARISQKKVQNTLECESERALEGCRSVDAVQQCVETRFSNAQ